MSQVFEIGAIYLWRNEDGSYRFAKDGWSQAVPLDLDNYDALREIVQLMAPRLATLLEDDHRRWTHEFSIRNEQSIQLHKSLKKESMLVKGRRKGLDGSQKVRKSKSRLTEEVALGIFDEQMAVPGVRRRWALARSEKLLAEWAEKDPANRYAWKADTIARKARERDQRFG